MTTNQTDSNIEAISEENVEVPVEDKLTISRINTSKLNESQNQTENTIKKDETVVQQNPDNANNTETSTNNIINEKPNRKPFHDAKIIWKDLFKKCLGHVTTAVDLFGSVQPEALSIVINDKQVIYPWLSSSL